MPYTSNNNYHIDSTGKAGYFYKSNSPLLITYLPEPSATQYTDVSFGCTPSLPNGLSIDASGSISGPTAINTLSDIDYTVSIRGKQISTDTTRQFATHTVRIVVSTEPKFTYLTSLYMFIQGSIITIPAPIIQALLWNTYYYYLEISYDNQINANTTNTLNINPKTGAIEGRVLNYTGKISCVVVINNQFITYTHADIIIDSVLPLQSIVYTGTNVVNNGGIFEFIQGIYGILQPSTQSSNGEYSILGCNTSTKLPLGLSFDASGNIFGSPQTISEPHIYTITFANSFESTSINIIICIKRRYILTPSLSYDVLITPELQMRRKAECLQHKSNKNNESSTRQLYNIITNGNRRIECLSRNIVKSSSSSGVPGPSINLFYDPATPFIGNVSRTRPINILP